MSTKPRRERVRRTVRGLALPIAVAIVVGVPRLALAASYGLAWTSPSPTPSPSPSPSPSPATAPCIEPKVLEQAITLRLGRDPFVPVERADVVLEGRELPPRAGRPRARVEQRAHDGRVLGSRDLEAATCAELVRATAFVVVLIVDPDALFRTSDPALPNRADGEPPSEAQPGAPRLAAAPSPTPPPSRPPPSAAEPSRAAPLARRPAASILSAGAGLTFASGLLPGGDVGGVVMLAVAPFRLPVGFEWRGSYHVSLASPRGRGFSAVEQEWRACYLFRRHAALGGSACAGGVWAAIFPQASGLRQGDQAPKGVLGPLVALGPTLRLGDYAVKADVSVFSPEPRYLFSYLDDAGRRRKLHELDRFVVAATIGVTRAF